MVAPPWRVTSPVGELYHVADEKALRKELAEANSLINTQRKNKLKEV